MKKEIRKMVCKKRKLHFSDKKSQSATELIMVLAVFLLLFTFVLFYTKSNFSIVNDTFSISQARNILRTIAHEADRVYQAGEGSSSRIFIPMPNGVNATSVSNKSIGISFENGISTHRVTLEEVRGFIPRTSAWLNIIAKEGYVQFYLDIIEVTPKSIFVNLMRYNSTSTSLSIINSMDDDVSGVINITSDVQLEINLSQLSFNVSQGSIITIPLNITVSGNASYGKHYAELIISANSAIDHSDMEIIVPIIVDVLYDGNQSSSIEAIMGILPGNWNTALFKNQVSSRYFYAFSGFPTNKTMRLSLSGPGSNLASFEELPNSSVQSLDLTVEAKDNKQFQLYLSPGSATTPGNYSIFLDYEYEKEVYGMNVTISGSVPITLVVKDDNNPPVIENMTASLFTAANGTIVCIYGDIVDDNGIDSAYIDYVFENDSAKHVELQYDLCASGKYGYSLLLDKVGNYNVFNVTAYDFALNMANKTINLTIQSILVSYTYSFNGTITENPFDGCYQNGSRTWNASSIGYSNDGYYISVPDDNWSSACGIERSDYVQFNFSNIAIYDRNVTSARISFKHKEDKLNGILPGGVEEFARYMILQCYNSTSYADIDTYYPTSDNASYYEYENIDISTCIKNKAIANNLSIRITFDPFNSTNNNSKIRTPMQYIDSIEVELATKDFFLLDLWAGQSNFPTRVDFSNSLNSTNNTFYINESSIYRSKSIINNSDFVGPSLSGWQTSGNISLAPGGNIILFSEGFEAANWNLSWTVNASSGIIARDGSEHSGSNSLAFSQFGTGEGYIYKALNLSGYTNVTLSFYYGIEDLESGDEGWLDIYNGTWHNSVIQLGPDNNGRTSTTPAQYLYSTLSLNPYGLGQDTRIRFRSSAANCAACSGDKDTMLIDDVSVLSSDRYGYTDYFTIDSSLNSTDFGAIWQNFTLNLTDYDIITLVNFTINYGIDRLSFDGTIFASCNITFNNESHTIWNVSFDSATINSSVSNEQISESRNITNLLKDKIAKYNINCSAYLMGDSEIAFKHIGISMNYTARSETDDGWDWQDDTYSHSGTIPSTFVKHADPSAKSDNVSKGSITLTIGGSGSATGSLMASGAWGIESFVNDTVYEAIHDHNGRAILSFNYRVIDLLNSTRGINGSVWIKSRFGKGSERNYLGSPLDNMIDSTLHYTDDSNEIWYLGDYKYPGFGSDQFGNGTIYRSFSQDITSYITSSGPYYLELGGIASWLDSYKSANEGLNISFTNIRILIEHD